MLLYYANCQLVGLDQPSRKQGLAIVNNPIDTCLANTVLIIVNYEAFGSTTTAAAAAAAAWTLRIFDRVTARQWGCQMPSVRRRWIEVTGNEMWKADSKKKNQEGTILLIIKARPFFATDFYLSAVAVAKYGLSINLSAETISYIIIILFSSRSEKLWVKVISVQS